MYKLLASILVSRWRRQILPTLIQPEQNAFIPGRDIADSILLVQELWHSIRVGHKNKRQFFLVKFDMEKAYDRVR